MVHVIRRLVCFLQCYPYMSFNGSIFHETEEIENNALSRSDRSIEHVLWVRPGKVASVKPRFVWVFAAV